MVKRLQHKHEVFGYIYIIREYENKKKIDNTASASSSQMDNDGQISETYKYKISMRCA